MASYLERRSQSDSPSEIFVPEDNAYVLDEGRRAALAQLDNATPSWFHVKICIAAGVGLFSDAYNVSAISIASVMLGYVYGGEVNRLSQSQDLFLKVAVPLSSLCGHLLFGFLTDVFGRKKLYGVTLIIIIFSIFAQALAGNSTAVSAIGVITFWRFIMGIGLGGEYPLGTVISSEFASKNIRGRMLTAVFAAQSLGQFTASLVGSIITVAYKSSILRDPSAINLVAIDSMWRLLIGLNSIPIVIGLYFRLTLPETPRFTIDIEQNVQQARADIQRVLGGVEVEFDPDDGIQRTNALKVHLADYIAYFCKRRNIKLLFATSYSWFALGIASSGFGLNTTIILQAIGFGASSTKSEELVLYENLKNICIGSLTLAAAGSIPGYWVTFFLIDKWGRKPTQLIGFIGLASIFIIMGFGYDKLVVNTPMNINIFVFLYCLANFFLDFPNTTTFIIPGEAFPTRFRSTAHGIAAASGKLGAIVAQVGFSRLIDIDGTYSFLKHIIEILAFFMITGIFSTLLLPETKGRTLENISDEDEPHCGDKGKNHPDTIFQVFCGGLSLLFSCISC